MSEPIQILILSDGKPGHENQSLGLAEAMARLRPAEIRILRLDPAKGRLGKARQALGEVEQKPDFIIAAGHSTTQDS